MTCGSAWALGSRRWHPRGQALGPGLSQEGGGPAALSGRWLFRG